MRFDFYRASLPTGTDAEQIINHLALHNPDGEIAEGRARMGYERCTSLRDGEGERWADVLHGGPNGVLVETSGEVSPAVVGVVRLAWPQHQVSRADVCEDLLADECGLFDRLHPELQRVVSRHGRVQAVTVRADKTEEGSSYRIGSRTSETFIRVYQKPEQLVATRQGDKSLRFFFDRWVRAEVEAKPQKDNRFVAATLPEEGFWGLSRIARQVSDVMFDLSIGRTGVIDYKQLTAKERARRSLVKMFGNTLMAWKEEVGSCAELGIVLVEAIREQQAERARRR